MNHVIKNIIIIFNTYIDNNVPAPSGSFPCPFLQTTFVVCFFILTNYILERRLYVKCKCQTA